MSETFSKGDYVRLMIAPNTRCGTLQDSRIERGRVQFLFRQDDRIFHVGGTPDFWVPEDEIEPCQPPSDAEVKAINAAIKRGS
jgi:hypothetical protein